MINRCGSDISSLLHTQVSSSEDRITRISIDSRDVDEHTLFVPIIGERVDAHKFIPEVLAKGCPLVLSSQPDEDYGHPSKVIHVRDTVQGLLDIGVGLRREIEVPVIGVTGSTGKTTTRMMIATALEAGGKVFSTKGNFNSQIGVPITMSQFDDDAYIGVLELGMSMPGEMKKIARVAQPTMVVFTNIGTAHLQYLGTRENILKEKMHITDYMPEGGIVLMNKDNDLLKTAVLREGLVARYYGLSDDADAYAENIDYSFGAPRFTAVIEGNRVDVELSSFGEHQVYNALAALYTAYVHGVDLKAAAEKLKEFKGYAHRQQIIEKNGITIIDDAYNANPDSMKAGLNVLSQIQSKGRRIAVLSEMRELGDEEELAHYTLGKYISKLGNIDILYTYCDEARYIGEYSGTKHYHFSDRDELLNALKNEVREGDVVLFKGSNGTLLYKLCDDFTAAI